MAVPQPAVTRADAYEASPGRPGAVIRVALSPGSCSRALTVAEARRLVAQIESAVAAAESGRPLPAVPKRPRWPPRPPEANAAALPAA